MSDLTAAWRFRVILDGSQYGFSKVSNLAVKMEYDSVAEGGSNGAPLLFRKAPQSRSTLILERGVKRSGSAALRAGTVIREFLLYVDEDKKTKKAARVYSFDEGIVTSVETGDLDAGDNHVLLEKVEIAHTGLVIVKR